MTKLNIFLLVTIITSESVLGSSQTDEELIDSLTELSDFTAGLHPTAWFRQFLAEADEEPTFSGGVLGSLPPTANSAMIKLVQRGPYALPSLLQHLDDPRPTQLVLDYDSPISWARSSNAYNNRPLGIDPIYELKNQSLKLPYIVKVGDVCQVIIGQITNRPQPCVTYTPSGGLTIRSPLIYPEIISEARKDWTDITVEEFKQHLLIEWRSDPNKTNPALSRIKYYFKEEYDKIINNSEQDASHNAGKPAT